MGAHHMAVCAERKTRPPGSVRAPDSVAGHARASGAVYPPAFGSADDSRRADSLAKRAFDIACAVIGLVFFGPLMLVIALAIWLTDGRPIFFAHERIGRGGHPFRCLKFRTMAVDGPRILEAFLANDPAARREWNAVSKLRIDPRITRIGSFLRKTSLDELPQLINVLRGDMSVVGPRPIVQAESLRYGRYFAYYCSARPGITGLWQISGRNHTTYKRRVALDIFYCRNRTFVFDVVIVMRTVPVVFSGDGAF